VDIMEKKFPKVHSYLSKFEKILRSRAAFRRYFRNTDPYWSMFNVSAFTFAPWKVVWRYIATEMMASVVGPEEDGRPVIPDCKLMLCEVGGRDEAFYLAAALNSAPVRLAVKAYTVSTQISTHVLDHICVPRFSPKDRTHMRLVELSKTAHEAASKNNNRELERIEDEVDNAAAAMWRLSSDELKEIKRSLEEA